MQDHGLRLGGNNFHLLRLIFAGSVCVFHAYTLSGRDEPAWVSNIFSATTAVNAFFIVSGFLIFMSYERSKSLGSYAMKRLRRIYPAYAFVVMACALSLWLVSSKPPADYFSIGWIKYVIANLTFVNFAYPCLPGVFEGHPNSAVNGALWTLKIEVTFYLSVPIFAYLFRVLGRLPVLIFLYAASLVYTRVLSEAYVKTGSEFYGRLALQLPGQLTYFMSGAFFYYYLPLFRRRTAYFVIPAALILFLNHYQRLPVLEPFALASIVSFFALFLYAGDLGKYGDFSYGVYILHWPIIQVALDYGLFRTNFPLFLITVSALTLLGAVAMWHLLEKRFLSRESRLVAATRDPREIPTAARMVGTT